MAHYAKVSNGVVTKVIVADAEHFDTFVDTTPGKWIQTSYNTKHGVHRLGGTPFRKNYAHVGGTYDSTRDAFIPPKPFASWVLNEDICDYESPVAYPSDGKSYIWDESVYQADNTKGWVENT